MTPEPTSRTAWLLRAADQAAVAGLVLIALVSMVGYWWASGGARGQWIDIDRASPREIPRFEVDLNSADWPELAQLPGVGETLARRIVASRETDGPYRHVDDLQRIRGIGARAVERVRPYLRPLPEPSIDSP